MKIAHATLPEDAHARQEACRQVGRQVELRRTHISRIRAADTVFHEGDAKTVCDRDLKRNTFMGDTLFGDSYVLGSKPVLVVVW